MKNDGISQVGYLQTQGMRPATALSPQNGYNTTYNVFTTENKNKK